MGAGQSGAHRHGTCYKVFKRDVIQSIDLDDRQGFAKETSHTRNGHLLHRAHLRRGQENRDEGRLQGALLHLPYNAPHAPLPIQLLIYLFIGGFSALCSLAFFSTILSLSASIGRATATAFVLAAMVNYNLCTLILFATTPDGTLRWSCQSMPLSWRLRRWRTMGSPCGSTGWRCRHLVRNPWPV